MQGQSILNTLFTNIIATGLVKEIFHSVLIRDIQGNKKPLVPVEGSFINVGPDDTQKFLTYCRANGPIDFEQEEKIGAQKKILWIRIPHKIVFFNDDEPRDHDQLTGTFIQAVVGTPGIRFARAYTIPDQILQTETNGQYTFTPSTYYSAIDFSLLLKLQANDCEAEFGFSFNCNDLKNPFC